MTSPTTADVLGAVAQRLRAAAAVLLIETPAPEGHPPADVHALLEALVVGVRERLEPSRVWLLLSALSAQFPAAAEVHATRRDIELASTRDAVSRLLRWAQDQTSYDDASAEIEIVTDRPIVDVDFSARNRLATGIQRVVRNLAPRWAQDHDVEMVRWRGHSYTRLSEDEAVRAGCESAFTDEPVPRRLIPWGTSVLLPEVPHPGHGARLGALAEFSPNRVALIGYDCIPVISAELVEDIEREKFGEYLELVKYVDTIAGISHTAAEEFSGFVSALAAQGLAGPTVSACSLPTVASVGPAAHDTARPAVPEVLCVGTLDMRKNQIVLVEAAEHLWREGLTFRLRLVGAKGAYPGDLWKVIDALVEAGRPIEVDHGVTDAALDRAYRDAHMVVFPTLHEGYGLPVVEALSYGVPVVTSDFGSTREIAEGNGALLVDPEDVGAVASAIRDLLLDEGLHAKLSEQARSRPVRTWDDYATEVWRVLMP